MLALNQIEHRAGMKNCHNDEGQLFARDTGKCEYRGGLAEVATISISSPDDLQKWHPHAKEHGGALLIGGLWEVQLDSEAAAKKLQKVIGGGRT